MNRYAIIVAGGIGSRMGASQPKQFLKLGNKPILIHTIEKFLAISPIQLILTLPKDYFETWHTIKNEHLPDISIDVIAGGSTRFHSVQNGLNHIQEKEGLVAIHDAVRPLVDSDTIESSFQQAEKYLSAVVSVPLKDSIRLVSKGASSAKNRTDYRLIQTPQTFQIAHLKRAFEQPYREDFTDDASVFEADGHQIHLIEGDYTNIKITTKEDLVFAAAILTQQKNKNPSGKE